MGLRTRLFGGSTEAEEDTKEDSAEPGKGRYWCPDGEHALITGEEVQRIYCHCNGRETRVGPLEARTDD